MDCHVTIMTYDIWHCAMKGIFPPKHFFPHVLSDASPHKSGHSSVFEGNKKLESYGFLSPNGIVALCEMGSLKFEL